MKNILFYFSYKQMFEIFLFQYLVDVLSHAEKGEQKEYKTQKKNENGEQNTQTPSMITRREMFKKWESVGHGTFRRRYQISFHYEDASSRISQRIK